MDSIVLYGAGGHAKSVIGVLEAEAVWELAGLLDDDAPSKAVLGYRVIGGRDSLRDVLESGINKAHVAIGENSARWRLANALIELGFKIVQIIHPSAEIMKNAEIGPGAFVHAYVVIGADCRIGDQALISAQTVIGHDSVVGNAVHFAPGVRLGGKVRVGDFTSFGMGTVVLPSIAVGRNVVVGANSVINRDLEDSIVVAGVPAREIGITEL